MQPAISGLMVIQLDHRIGRGARLMQLGPPG